MSSFADLAQAAKRMAQQKDTLLIQVVKEQIARHGGVRAMARALHVDAGYICRLRSGKAWDLSTSMQNKLRLRKIVTYERMP